MLELSWESILPKKLELDILAILTGLFAELGFAQVSVVV